MGIINPDQLVKHLLFSGSVDTTNIGFKIKAHNNKLTITIAIKRMT
jgi:hypothetical protein